MDQHIAALQETADAVRAWDERRAATEATNVAYANGLLGVARHEEAGRLAIVNYRPRGDRELRLKLAYMAVYLIATRGTLNPHEMNAVLEAPPAIRQARRFPEPSLCRSHNSVLRPHCFRLCRRVPYRTLRRTRQVLMENLMQVQQCRVKGRADLLPRDRSFPQAPMNTVGVDLARVHVEGRPDPPTLICLRSPLEESAISLIIWIQSRYVHWTFENRRH